MTIIEFIFNPITLLVYFTGVGIGILISLHQKTKAKFMAALVLTSMWPLSIIAILSVEFYHWYTNLKDE